MKTITIDLKSFCFGVLAMGTVLLMANKPAGQSQPEPMNEVRRYQAIMSEYGPLVLDTKTGRFIVDQPAMSTTRWRTFDLSVLFKMSVRKVSSSVRLLVMPYLGDTA